MFFKKKNPDLKAIDDEIKAVKDEIDSLKKKSEKIYQMSKGGPRDYHDNDFAKNTAGITKKIQALNIKLQQLKKKRAAAEADIRKGKIKDIINESGGFDMDNVLFNSDDIKARKLKIYEAVRQGSITEEDGEQLLEVLEEATDEYTDSLAAILEAADDEEDDDEGDAEDNENDDESGDDDSDDDDEDEEITKDDIKKLKVLLGQACKDKKIKCALKDKILDYLDED